MFSPIQNAARRPAYREIATTLGISVKTVEARMSRALEHFRQRLAPWLPQEDDR